MLFKIFFPCYSIFLMAILSCTSNGNNKNIAAQVDSTLAATNKALRFSNSDLIEALKQKAGDQRTKVKALIWLPKVLSIDSLTQNLIHYVDSLKNELHQNSNSQTGDQSVQNLFVERSQSDKLYRRLQQYKIDVIAVDERMKEVTTSIDLTGQRAAHVTGNEDFKKNFFAVATAQEVITLLNSLQTTISHAENKLLLLCKDQIIFDFVIYHSFEAIVGQNAKILKAGDYLEITSGLGSFNVRSLSGISIGGKNIPTNENGFVVYKFKTSKKVGNYSVPVTISFADQDGKQQTRTIPVEYSLVDSVIKK